MKISSSFYLVYLFTYFFQVEQNQSEAKKPKVTLNGESVVEQNKSKLPWNGFRIASSSEDEGNAPERKGKKKKVMKKKKKQILNISDDEEDEALKFFLF